MNNGLIIIGGGMVGLALAALLSQENFEVTVVEVREFDFSDTALTARVSTIHLASQRLLRYLNVWEHLEKNAAPLFEMTIWDHTQNAHLQFDSRDVNELQMGWVIENREIVRVLYEKLIHEKRVTFLNPYIPTSDFFEKYKHCLIIGADGAHSCVRERMPVSLTARSYFQKAIIAVIQSEKSHENTAFQKFLTTGPAALLPLKNKHHTALVWSADDAVSDALMQKSMDAFSEALTTALDFKLGKLKTISERTQFPLVMQHAEDYVSDHFALVGDAAHTIHPLAGLGVNLGLMDAACLAQTLIDARAQKKPITDLRTLRRYARWRKGDNLLTIAAMRGLKEIFAIDNVYGNFIRSLGVNAVDHCGLIKNNLMKYAMGMSNELPTILSAQLPPR